MCHSNSTMEHSLLPPGLVFPKSVDSTRLTGPQKATIYGAWLLIKKKMKFHANTCFQLFFEKYPEYMTMFNFGPENLQENRVLHAHATVVFSFITNLIEVGFEDPEVFNQILKKIIKNHQIRNVPVGAEDVMKLGGVILEYLLTELHRQRTNTLEEALKIFFKRIAREFDPNHEIIPESDENIATVSVGTVSTELPGENSSMNK